MFPEVEPEHGGLCGIQVDVVPMSQERQLIQLMPARGHTSANCCVEHESAMHQVFLVPEHSNSNATGFGAIDCTQLIA
jgi:hypothetical protein